jgi:hypothetical protein
MSEGQQPEYLAWCCKCQQLVAPVNNCSCGYCQPAPKKDSDMPSPLTTGAQHPPQRVLVRESHSDHRTWRDVFGPAEFLHAWSCDGSLDAREWVPAGSTLEHGRTSAVFRSN